jgi:hypothetical protein
MRSCRRPRRMIGNVAKHSRRSRRPGMIKARQLAGRRTMKEIVSVGDQPRVNAATRLADGAAALCLDGHVSALPVHVEAGSLSGTDPPASKQEEWRSRSFPILALAAHHQPLALDPHGEADRRSREPRGPRRRFNASVASLRCRGLSIRASVQGAAASVIRRVIAVRGWLA